MEVTFLGGAEEIGASCTVVDVRNVRLIVDCGQRMQVSQGLALPDFSYLEDGPPISAILLTHAHADHIGALPALEPFLPADCPIYGTESTLALAKVMLNDTVRIMTQYRRGDGELPLFPTSTVSGVLNRFQMVRWGKAVPVAPADIFATWFPAGHILGAAMIHIRTPRKSVLFTGDISVADQNTVPGVFAPAIQPQLVILESTYGNRMHAHRPAQERLIVERVKQSVEAGGSVLFPTFALGRAQEVLLVLGRAMREGTLPEMPVYADGLVRPISRVYSRFAHELAPFCRELWELGQDPIFPDDLPIRPVRDNAHREQIAIGKPCVVVSSSGMLQGGASAFYARHWLGDPSSLILITGYVDEESPGQALLNLAATPDGQPRYFKLGGILTEVACQVGSYSLSAHADNGELVSLACKLRPEQILLVHGDATAREALARSLLASCKADVQLPVNGETYHIREEYTPASARSLAGRPNPLALWPPWDPLQPRPLDLEKTHAWLAAITPKIPWVTLEELAELWKTPEPVTAEDWTALREAVYGQVQPYFVPDARRPTLLHLTPLENLLLADAVVHRLTSEQATTFVHELFPFGSGLRRFGFYPDEGILRLEFVFPKAASQRYVQRIGELAQRTGWKIEHNDRTHDTDLLDALRQSLPLDAHADVSIDHEQGIARVLAPISNLSAEPDFLAERFLHKTGYRLELDQAAMATTSHEDDGND